MTQHSFTYSKITRALTAISTCVLLLVCTYSFFLGFQNTLFRKEMASSSEVKSEKSIIIDAGHGGEDGGAVSDGGILEKHINLSVCQSLNEIFSLFGYNTIMTRDADRLIYDSGCDTIRQKKVSDIRNRMALIEKTPDCVFLSIHQNHYESMMSCGTQVFYSANNPLSEKLAGSIQQTIVSDIQHDNARKIKKSGKEIYLLYHAQVPAVMVECGFLSNPSEALKLSDKDYQKTMAFEIFKGTISSGG